MTEAEPDAGRIAQATAATKERIRPYAERADQSFIGQVYNRLLEIEFIDRSIALAAKLFISFFPFLLGIAMFSPDTVKASFQETLIHRLGLSGESLEAFRGAFTTVGNSKDAIGFLGLILLIAYATSFTTALQRIYMRAWRRPVGGGWRNQRRGVTWLVGMILFAFIAGSAGRILAGWTSLASTAFGIVLAFFVWWWTSWLMLRTEVKWRALIPGAAINALSMSVYIFSAGIWMPRMVVNNQAEFGYFGITMSLVTYFVGLSFIIVISAVLSPALVVGDSGFAKWLRGNTDTPLRPGAPQPLPPTGRRLRITDALGLSRDADADAEVATARRLE